MNVCTIVAPNYLAQATVLARSLAAHHPGTRLTTLVLTTDRGAEREAEFDVLLPMDLELAERDFALMASIYDATELATAVKPALLATMLRHHGTALYLDPDMQVFASIAGIPPLTEETGLLLTPHNLRPLPPGNVAPSEREILGAGAFNLGFIAVTRDATDFLAWWDERLRLDCLRGPEHNLCVDQRWVDLGAVYFPHQILADEGCNVAWWNLPTRDVAFGGDGFTVNGVPLRIFHFSGFDPRRPDVLTQRPGHPIMAASRPAIAKLCRDYATDLITAGFDEHTASPYPFARTTSGAPMTPAVRKMYRLAAQHESGPPPPFGTTPGRAFERWATPIRRAERVQQLFLRAWRPLRSALKAGALWYGRRGQRR